MPVSPRVIVFDWGDRGHVGEPIPLNPTVYGLDAIAYALRCVPCLFGRHLEDPFRRWCRRCGSRHEDRWRS